MYLRLGLFFFFLFNLCFSTTMESNDENEAESRKLIEDLLNLSEIKPYRFLGFPKPTSLLSELFVRMPVSTVREINHITFHTQWLFNLAKKFPLPAPPAAKAVPTTTTTTKAPPKYPAPATPKPIAHTQMYSSYAQNPYQRVDDMDFSRADFYEEIERFLEKKGLNGRQCLLRSICEVAEAPFDQGMYGDVLNFLLSSSVSNNETEYYDEYRTAEYYGKYYGHCEKIYESCPTSVLDFYSKVS